MLTFDNIAGKSMSFSKSKTKSLTEEEWNELVALKNAINDNPASVHPEKMELFTQLLVKSWETDCDENTPNN
jgi:hypothetical protein